jgi:predicted nucleic acid-binding protein
LEQFNQRLQSTVADFVLADAQSFHVAEHPLFKELLKTAIEIG